MKAGLEAEARRQGLSLSALLDQIAGQWLRRRRKRTETDAEEQARLHRAVEKCIGSISGPPDWAESADRRIRENLARKYDRNRSH